MSNEALAKIDRLNDMIQDLKCELYVTRGLMFVTFGLGILAGMSM